MSGAIRKTPPPAPLGDGPQRDYARKLDLFSTFAAAELRSAVDMLELQPGMRVLDAGCGTGGILPWLQQAVGQAGVVAGFDLSAAHAAAARRGASPCVSILQASLEQLPFREASFDLIWCGNAIHHAAAPLAVARRLRSLVRSGGRLVVAQSFLLPELLFAWNARLERRVTAAIHRYYRERHGIPASTLSEVRGVVGLARRMGLHDVTVRTVMIERITPLTSADTAYLRETLFSSKWCERLRPYLGATDFALFQSLCDPASDRFALVRDDFHYLQSLTMVTGVI